MTAMTGRTRASAAANQMAPVPTRWTVFLRTFVPWQMVRFVVINLKMFRLIWRSH